MSADQTTFFPAPRFDLKLVEGAWAFADENADAIDAHWAKESAKNPAIFNGKVLVAIRSGLRDDGTYFGEHLSVDFKAFLAWRDWGFGLEHGCNIFGSALICPADGGIIMGVMGDHTSNPGLIYPASGTLDLSDVGPDGTIDIEASMQREMLEETGLSADMFERGNAFVIAETARVSVARQFHSKLDAQILLGEIRANLETQTDRELADIAYITKATEMSDAIFLPYVQRIVRELA